MVQQSISTGTFCEAKWVVSATAGQGTHTTISAALAASASGDTIFIRDGTYTENPSLVAGVSLVAYVGDSLTPNVTIVGNCTFSSAGTVSISGIRLQTNSAALLTVSGSAASIVNLYGCYLNCSNNTGITFSSSSSSAQITITSCGGNIGTTGISYFTMTSTGTLYIFDSQLFNSGLSVTASTNSSGTSIINSSYLLFPLTTTGTATIQTLNTTVFVGGNGTGITHGGTGGSSYCMNCNVETGTASSISIGAGATLTVCNTQVSSSNTNALTGSGILKYAFIAFYGSSSGHNVSTETALSTLI